MSTAPHEPPGQVHPLAELNRYIRQVSQQPDAGPAEGRAEPGAELRSVRRFRESWSRIAASDRIDQALVRGPDNAGPLNSHRLVLHSLSLMRELSPDYLRRFLSHAETLLWLDHSSQPAARVKAKPARRAPAKK